MIQNSNILKIAEIFFSEPTRTHYLIEISKKSKLAHTSVKNYLTSLKKEGIIKEILEKRGKRIFPIYTANLESLKYKQYKKVHNLDKLIHSGLVEFLRDRTMPRSIVLFGSYSRGEDVEDSDIDIFVESKKQEIGLKSFEKIINKKIELHFSEKFNSYPRELKNNILNGDVLYGYLEVFP